MSTEASFENLEAFKKANSFIREDGQNRERKAWLLVEHVNDNPHILKLSSTSEEKGGSLDDFAENLRDDQVMYGLIRLTSTVDMSTTVKFVYVRWIGSEVRFAKLGKFGVVHGSISKNFDQYHCFIETSNKSELTEDSLMNILETNAGTRNHVLEGSTVGRQERGFTANQTKLKKESKPSRIAPKPLSIDVSPEVYDAINNVHNDNEENNWCLVGFENGKVDKKLILLGEGAGNFENVSCNFKEEQVMFALYRLTDSIDGIVTVKFAYIYWLGEKVKPLQKAKVSAYCQPIEALFRAHVGLTMSSLSEAKESVIIEKVSASTGSKIWVK